MLDLGLAFTLGMMVGMLVACLMCQYRLIQMYNEESETDVVEPLLYESRVASR